MLLAGFERDHITRTDVFDRSAPTLHAAETCGHDERLAKRMRVPGRARAGLEGDLIAGNARGIRGRKQRIDPHRAGEILGRSPDRRLRASLPDLHLLPP